MKVSSNFLFDRLIASRLSVFTSRNTRKDNSSNFVKICFSNISLYCTSVKTFHNRGAGSIVKLSNASSALNVCILFREREREISFLQTCCYCISSSSSSFSFSRALKFWRFSLFCQNFSGKLVLHKRVSFPSRKKTRRDSDTDRDKAHRHARVDTQRARVERVGYCREK